jgi:dihydropteroate synthase
VQPLHERIPGPALMGIVNVTPDSFSDGGAFADAEAAIAHGLRLAAEGAVIVDVGGESTRPGSDPVDTGEELARVLPVVAGITRHGVAVSIDTSKAAVAEAAIEAGAAMVNDVTALGDPAMADVVAAAGVDLCLMHMQGTPRTMQEDPQYEDVVAEVTALLAERVARAIDAGVRRERIAVDPGIGFGKTVDHNLALLDGVAEIGLRTGCPVLVGASRKRFLGALMGDTERDRTAASVGAGLRAVRAGAWMLRVHDVVPHHDALAVYAARG